MTMMLTVGLVSQWPVSLEAARGGKTEVLPAQKAAPAVVTIDRSGSEQELRAQLREKNKVTELGSNGSFSRVPTGSFGFIAPRMLGMALVTQSPDLALERTPQGNSAFEVHKLADGNGMLVGFVSRELQAELSSSHRPKNVRITLHSNPSDKAPVIVAVPIVKLMADRMPFRLDPKNSDGTMVFEMDLQSSVTRQSVQGGP